MMSRLEQRIQDKLTKREQEGTLRKLSAHDDALIDFTSNDYLGLGRSTELFDQIRDTTETLLPRRNGAGGSRLLSGNYASTEEIETTLAGIFKSEACLVFNSGYAANMAVLSSLPSKDDTIIYDELSHACIKDGARLSLASRFSFRHNDLSDLERKLSQVSGIPFVVVESIYSMDGDLCPLTELVAVAKKYHGIVIIDEAHSTGVMGETGSGLSVSLNLQDDIDIRIYTFGKAMGIHGACVASSRIVRDHLINFSRPFIYTTALPPHSLASIACAFEYLAKNVQLQSTLYDKIKLFKSTYKGNNISESAIQPVIIPGNANAKKTAVKLREEGFDVRAVLSPTVKPGSERLRICIHTFNTDDEILRLAGSLNQLTDPL